jgi:hypothetical protein
LSGRPEENNEMSQVAWINGGMKVWFIAASQPVRSKREDSYTHARAHTHFTGGTNDDRLCGLVVTVPGYTTEMHCDSCEVRTEFIYVM